MKPIKPNRFDTSSIPREEPIKSGFNFLLCYDPDERERLRAQSPITVSMDPGSTCYLLSTFAEQTKDAFQSSFPSLNFERQRNLHSPLAGTTLEII